MDKFNDVVAFPPLALAEPLSPLRIPRRKELGVAIKELRMGKLVSDARFDAIYPKAIQRLSPTHWTPVRVARRAAEFLARGKKTRILDIGSGAGKFCLVASLTTDSIFVGVEQRGYLVSLCRKLADHYGIERARFVQGNMMELDWSSFDGFYFYNPFIENIYDAAIRIDNGLQQTRPLFEHYVRMVQIKLHRAPAGTRVVTYFGFGGEMPPGYRCKRREPIASDRLAFWEKE